MFNWPIWLRNFTFNRMRDRFDKQREEADKQRKMMQNLTSNNKNKEVAKPNLPQSNYSTKAAKK